MNSPSNTIASETKNCSFNLETIDKFLALMATQQTEYSDFNYKANGPFSLVLKAKKNRVAEVALKVLECTCHTESQIQTMEREYAMLKQISSSDYLLAIYNQFYLTETKETSEQGKNGNSDIKQKVYFVQEMEICQRNLEENIQWISQNGKEIPKESEKELLAIQMLDAVNLLHQRQIAHGNITTQNLLVQSGQDYPILLKLCNIRFTSRSNLRISANSVQGNDSLNCVLTMTENQRNGFEQDLVSLGKVILQLDNIGTNFDCSIISNSELAQLDSKTIFETFYLNRSTLLNKIACELLSKSEKNQESARSMLLLLLKKQTELIKIPLFSILSKNQISYLRLQIPNKRIMLDFLLNQASKQQKLQKISSQFDSNGQRKTQLTANLLKSALKIMLDWKEFSGEYDILGVGVGGIVFGVENLKENRKSALKLSLCTSKSNSIREIDLLRICQSPYIVKLFWMKFFKDSNGNEFVVQEFERCKYSLTHHLELQRINGEFSEEQKRSLALQIISSVNFLHKNRILHRNIKLDNFLIAENESGQQVVKLGNFSHAAQLQESFERLLLLEWEIFDRKYRPPLNCIIQKHNRESPLYFAPEKQENPNLSTYFTDSFSVGICIFLLGNYLVCSEEQLAIKLNSVPRRSAEIYLGINTQIDIIDVNNIAKQLLWFLPKQRTSLGDLAEKCSKSWGKKDGISKDLDENYFQQQINQNIQNYKELDHLQQTPMRYESLSLTLNIDVESLLNPSINLLNPIGNLLNLSSICIKLQRLSFDSPYLLSPLVRLVKLKSMSLDLTNNQIQDKVAQPLLSSLKNLINLSTLALNLSWNQIRNIGASSLLSPFENLLNLSSLAINLDKNSIGDTGAQSLLSPLANLHNLTNITINLIENQIGAIGAQFLLIPLENLPNVASLSVNLGKNQIGDIGAQFLFIPLANLLNLANLSVNLKNNQIEDIGAQSLLSPLANLLNLSSLDLNLENNNEIRDIGASSLLHPLANLNNLSNLCLNLSFNSIGQIGASSLLSPLAKLLNLSSLDLNLENNYKIGDIGVSSLLFPLANLNNLSNLSLNLSHNSIGQIGASSLLSPLVNLINLSSLTLHLNWNSIGAIGAKFLLVPLTNLLKISSLFITLTNNQIGDIGAQSLLSSLVNLHNLTDINLNLNSNSIGDIGASCLLLPLSNLLNLSMISLCLHFNKMGDIGFSSLFDPLSNILSLSSLSIIINFEFITKRTKHLFKHYFKNLTSFGEYE